MSTTDQRSIAEGLAECIDGASPDARSIPTGLEAITSALLAIHDLLDARLPATTVGGGDENGAHKGAGRIGWLTFHSTGEHPFLAREVPGGWAHNDSDDAWWDGPALEDYTTFTPLPVAQDDEVIVKRAHVEATVALLDREKNPAAVHVVTVGALRAALDRGQGA